MINLVDKLVLRELINQDIIYPVYPVGIRPDKLFYQIIVEDLMRIYKNNPGRKRCKLCSGFAYNRINQAYFNLFGKCNNPKSEFYKQERNQVQNACDKFKKKKL